MVWCAAAAPRVGISSCKNCPGFVGLTANQSLPRQLGVQRKPDRTSGSDFRSDGSASVKLCGASIEWRCPCSAKRPIGKALTLEGPRLTEEGVFNPPLGVPSHVRVLTMMPLPWCMASGPSLEALVFSRRFWVEDPRRASLNLKTLFF